MLVLVRQALFRLVPVRVWERHSDPCDTPHRSPDSQPCLLPPGPSHAVDRKSRWLGGAPQDGLAGRREGLQLAGMSE